MCPNGRWRISKYVLPWLTLATASVPLVVLYVCVNALRTHKYPSYGTVNKTLKHRVHTSGTLAVAYGSGKF